MDLLFDSGSLLYCVVVFRFQVLTLWRILVSSDALL